MAVTLGDAIVYLRGDDSELGKAFRKGEQEAKGFAERAGDAIKKGLLAATGAVVGGVAAIGAGVFKLATDSAQIPGVTQRFDNLTASIGTTRDAMLGGLRQAVQGTVTDFDLLLQGNKLMQMGLASSSEEASKLATIAYQLGDPTRTVTENMENLALMLANQSILRLDSFGISSGKVRERIEELTKSEEGMTRETAFMTAFMEQAEVSMQRIGPRTNDAAVQMAQLKVAMQNIKDAAGVALIPVLSAVLKPLGDLAAEYGPRVTDWATGFAAKLTGEVIPKIQSFGGAFQEGIALITGTGGDWSAFNEYLSSVFGQSAANIITDAGAMVAGVVGMVKSGDWAGLGEMVVSWVRDNAPKALQQLGEWGGQIVAKVRELIPPAKAKLLELGREFVQWIGPQIPPMLASLLQFMTSLVQGIAARIPDVVSKLLELATKFVEWITPQVPPMLTKLLEFMLAVIQGIGSKIPDVVSKLGELAVEFVNWVAPRVGPLLEELAKLGVAITEWIVTTALPLIAEKLAVWGGAFLGWVQDAVLPKLSDELGKIVAGITTWIGQQTETLITEAKGLGDNIVAGIRQGIEDAWLGLLERWQGLLEQLPAWLRKLLGIASPSSVMRALGIEIPAGLAAGIDAGAGEAIAAMVRLVREIVDNARGISEGLSTALPTVSAGAMSGLLDTLRAFAQEAANWMVGPHGQGIQEFVKWFKDVLTPILSDWVSNMQPVQSLIGLARDLTQGLSTELAEVRVTVGSVLDRLAQISAAVVTWTDEHEFGLSQLIPALARIRGTFESWANSLGPLGSIVQLARTLMGGLVDDLQEAKATVAAMLTRLAEISLAVVNWTYEHEFGLGLLLESLANIREKLEKWAASLQPVSALLTLVKGLLDLAAIEAADVKLSVVDFLDNLLSFLSDILFGLETQNLRLWSAVFGLTKYKSLLEALKAALEPLQPVLSLTKGILDAGAEEVKEVKLSVSLFFETLLSLVGSIVSYVSENELRLWSAAFALGSQKALLLALKASLEPLQPALSLVKGILDIAASEVKDVKLSVSAFFEGFLNLSGAISSYVTENELRLWSAIFAIGSQKTLLEALKAALDPLQPALSLVKGILDLAAGEVKETKLQVKAFFDAFISISGEIVNYLVQNGAAVDGAIVGLKGQETRLVSLKAALEPLQPVLSLVQGILKIASEEVKSVKLSVAAFFGHLIEFANAVSSYFLTNAPALDEAIAGLVSQGPRMLSLEAALKPLVTVLQAVQNTIREGESVSEGRLEQTFNQRIIPVIQNVRGVLRALYDRLVGMELAFMPDLLVRLGSLRDTFKSVLDMVAIILQGGEPTGSLEGKTSLIDAFQAALSKGLENAKGYLQRFYDYLVGDFAVKLAAIDLSSIGYNIGKSLADGLLSSLGLVEAAAAALAAAAGGGPARAGYGSAAGRYGGMQPVGVAAGGTSVHLHVGTLIADDAGLRKLEGTLRRFREQEDARRSGA